MIGYDFKVITTTSQRPSLSFRYLPNRNRFKNGIHQVFPRRFYNNLKWGLEWKEHRHFYTVLFIFFNNNSSLRVLCFNNYPLQSCMGQQFSTARSICLREDHFHFSSMKVLEVVGFEFKTCNQCLPSFHCVPGICVLTEMGLISFRITWLRD